VDRGNVWTGLINIFQVLEKTPSMTNCRSESHYTLMTLEHLLVVNNNENFHTLLQLTTTPQLFMMWCDINELISV
jgi:hypothetical protein